MGARPDHAALTGLSEDERATTVAEYFGALELDPSALDPSRTTAEAFLAAITDGAPPSALRGIRKR